MMKKPMMAVVGAVLASGAFELKAGGVVGGCALTAEF